jgi:N-acyl-D-aspartate/D-glutamate deacylase
VVVFDADRIADRATYTEPHRDPQGIRDVIVNGVFVLDGGQLTDARPGQFLERPPVAPR